MEKSQLRRIIQEAIGGMVEPGRCKDSSGEGKGCGGQCRYPSWHCGKEGCDCEQDGKIMKPQVGSMSEGPNPLANACPPVSCQNAPFMVQAPANHPTQPCECVRASSLQRRGPQGGSKKNTMNEETSCQEAAQAGLNDCYDTHYDDQTGTFGSGWGPCKNGVMSTFNACKAAAGGGLQQAPGRARMREQYSGEGCQSYLATTTPECRKCTSSQPTPYNPPSFGANMTGPQCQCCDDEQTGGEDPIEIKCQCCKNGLPISMVQTVMGWPMPGCSVLNDPSAGLSNCSTHPLSGGTPIRDCGSRSGENGDGCPDVSCVNPLHVQGPAPRCECKCEFPVSCIKPNVFDEATCSCKPIGRGGNNNSITGECCKDPQGVQIATDCVGCAAPNSCTSCNPVSELYPQIAEYLKKLR